MGNFEGTPGAWEVAGPCCDAVATDFDSDCYKAICHRPARTGGKLTDEYNANMRLIAAAPELLEALQDALHAYDKHGEHSEWDFARAAISKALSK